MHEMNVNEAITSIGRNVQKSENPLYRQNYIELSNITSGGLMEKPSKAMHARVSGSLISNFIDQSMHANK